MACSVMVGVKGGVVFVCSVIECSRSRMARSSCLCGSLQVLVKCVFACCASLEMFVCVCVRMASRMFV